MPDQPIPRMTDEEMRRMAIFTQPVNPNPLATLDRDIREHWEEFLPAKVAALKTAGQYDAAVAEAVAQTEADMEDVQANGMGFFPAWEAVRQRYAFLPAEPDIEDDDEPGEDEDADE